MKNLSALALFIVCAPLAAHAQTATSFAALPMAPKSAETSDAFVWRFAPPVGSRWTLRSFTRSTSLLPADTEQDNALTKITSIQKLTADYDVLSRDHLGATTIRLTLREVTMNATLTFSNGETVEEQMQPSRNGKAVNGATLTVKQTPNGEVWGIVGMRAFQRKILEARGVGPAMVEQTLNTDPLTNDSELVKAMNPLSGALPASPVRTGESWNYKVSLSPRLPIALFVNGTRTLKKLDSAVAIIADSARYSGGNPKTEIPSKHKGSHISIDYGQLSGAINGVTRVQRLSGLPLETTINQTIMGNISAEYSAAGAEPQRITTPTNVTTSTRIVLEPR